METEKQLFDVINLLRVSEELKNGLIAEMIGDQTANECEVKDLDKSDKGGNDIVF